ncbi:nucleotidyltransferase domain-containing protein [Pseudalkalibacillus sp. Hm43]|uniref:nucleotidyltransferase domain-containing protein n=1 Tax=Pseudalkalibacillus sp. Hm43 TaxID=3450742 RepID=UPI003F43856D
MQRYVLSYITKVLCESNVRWAAGGSNVLAQYGLIKSPRDIDLLIDINDVEKASHLIEESASPIEAESYTPFRTEIFRRYLMDETEIDFMAGFAIEHEKGIYRFHLNNESLTKQVVVDGYSLPLSSLEDWFILYQLIPNKGDKANLIELYWKENGILHPFILRKALEQPLPDQIIDRTMRLLNEV